MILSAKFRLPKIYIPKVKGTQKPDLLKNWYVEFYFRSPTGEMKRFKHYEGINTHNTIAARILAAGDLLIAITELLTEQDYNPFVKEYELVKDSTLAKNCLADYILVKESQVTRKTVSMIKSRVGGFVSYLMQKTAKEPVMSEIKGKDISDYINSLLDNGTISSNNTANLYRSMINSFFDFFIKKEGQTILKINPTNFVATRKVIKVGNRPYTDPEFNRVLEYTSQVNPYLNFMIKFIYYTCMRPGKEIRLCQVKHILLNPKGNRILIPAGNSKTGQRLGEDQYIPLDENLFEILQDKSILDSDPEFYIFSVEGKPGPNPINVNYWDRSIQKMRKELNLKPDQTLYSAKHTRICHLFLDGHNFEEIRKLTRHTNNAVLMDYLKGLGLMLEENQKFKSRKI